MELATLAPILLCRIVLTGACNSLLLGFCNRDRQHVSIGSGSWLVMGF
jgi:hypothetical protein